MRQALFGCMLALAALCKAQTGVSLDNFTGVDSLVNAFLGTWNIKGGSVAITHQGRLVYNKGFGFAGGDSTVPMPPNALFRIASVSKPITSIALMKLADEGRLSLSDTVFGPGRLLDQPYYLNAIGDPRLYSVTVQQLLEHTAGWDRNVPYGPHPHSDAPFFPLEVAALEEAPNPVGDSTLIRFSLQLGLQRDPGTKYAYSNTGYLVLGKIIEKVSGMSYEAYVKQHILHPLSIYDMHLGKNLRQHRQAREAEYFNDHTTFSCYGDGSRVPWQYGGFNLEAMNAHGGWIASAADLSRLMLSVDGFSTVPDILSPEAIKLMSSPGAANPAYAKGWSVSAANNWWHTGSLEGSAAFICRTNGGFTWTLLFNSRGDNSLAFWRAFDRLPQACIASIRSFPSVDLFAPSANVSALKVNLAAPDSAHISWTRGNGDGSLIVATEAESFSTFPEDGATYAAAPAFGRGAALGQGTFVIYNGTGQQATITGLDPKKSYIICGFEYFRNAGTSGKEVYKLGKPATAVLMQVTPKIKG